MTLYPNSLQVAAMRYGNKPTGNKLDIAMTSKDYVLQQKLDGAWYALEVHDNEHIYLFSRSVSKKTGELSEKSDNVPHIITWARDHVPHGTTLIGEIYVPGGKSNNVTSIMGALPAKAYERQFKSDAFGGPLHYYIFDCVRFKGEDITNETFEQRMLHLMEDMNGQFDDASDYIHLAKTYTLDKEDPFTTCLTVTDDGIEFHDSFQETLSDIFAAGGEGAVLKRKDSKYEPGKRPTHSFKIKEHIDSIDLVVMELLEPERLYTGKEIASWPYWMENCESDSEWTPCTRKDLIEMLQNDNYESGVYCAHHHSMNFMAVTKPYYYGWKNAIKLGAYNNEGTLVEVGRVASGLDDGLRRDLALNPSNYIGTCVEVECMSVDKNEHTLRHPVFKRFRDDKDTSECILEEIFK